MAEHHAHPTEMRGGGRCRRSALLKTAVKGCAPQCDEEVGRAVRSRTSYRCIFCPCKIQLWLKGSNEISSDAETKRGNFSLSREWLRNVGMGDNGIQKTSIAARSETIATPGLVYSDQEWEAN